MSEHKKSVREALEEQLGNVSQYADTSTSGAATIDHEPQSVRHPVRQVEKPLAPPSLRTRQGRFHPETLVCIFCNVARHEHGKVCGRDDYTEWQRVLRDACKSGKAAPEHDYVAKRQADGWADHGTQSAHKLARS